MFKKGILALFMAMIAISIQASLVMASEYYDYIKIMQLVIGDKKAEVNSELTVMEQASYIKEGRTLVPLRFIGESLGAQVSWDNSRKRVVLNLTGTDVTVPIASNVAYVDGKPIVLDVPAEIKSGRTFIPLRFISESFGANVDYNEKTNTVRVLYVDQPSW
ncbi:MAG: copper amine oxidase N-terminal domain-containing protein [Rubrobacteridae bacterium]|nr:copper amine oxidase N-terminal domain-containing protein [Rubrobacteridae bacterium]